MSYTEYPIHVDQLCIGVYIKLDAEAQRSFSKSEFKISSLDQISKLKATGISHVTCVLDKCDELPIPLEEARPKAKPEENKPRTPVSTELLGLKRETIERNKERKARFSKYEKRYDKTMMTVAKVMRRVSGKSHEAVSEASILIKAMVDTFLSDTDVVLGLMTNKPTDERKNYHSLNVTVLSMMVAKEFALQADAMHVLGMGALFHDVGKGRIPIKELKGGKATAMNAILEAHNKVHPEQGARLALDMPDFPRSAARIILEHHETLDGKGYPKGLKGEEISAFARIVHVVDAYDNMLNGKEDDAPALTPHQALKTIFALTKKTGSMDQRIVSTFVRCLGVYPPGTIVQLSNGTTGMVLSTNPAKAARPTVLIHHPDVPKKEALVIDLITEDTIEITGTMLPDDLPREVYTYLSPVSQYNYYVESAS